MRFLKFLAAALVVAMGLSSCNPKDKHDHSADIVGTWTCLTENYAEALIINADGTAVSYGVENGEYWENVSGTVVTEGDNITMTFEDNDNLTGHFDIIPGQAFSLFEDSGERYTYQYCENDLADEIVGMWVSTDDSSIEENNMFIQTFDENGISTYTGFGEMDGEIVVEKESHYKVVGDACFQEINGNYFAWKVTYSQNGTSLGDIMTITNGDFISSWLRIRQSLDLVDNAYAYKAAYVTNAKGKDEDFSIMGHTFNIAKIKASDFDVMFGADLFLAEFPNSNTMRHRFHIDGQDAGFDAQIVVEGNKVTLDMSVVNPALRKVDMYMFQDADDSQLHMYMPTASFINYFANMELYALILEGEINQTDEAAIEKVFTDMEARIESINVSFVFKILK